MTPVTDRLPSSFRDPSGFLFKHNDILYRQINNPYKPDYDLLMQSGLYERLTLEGLLIPHKEVDPPHNPYKIIQPEIIPFISYPYEWCFSQLKDAALATLKIQKIALDFGMSLKDGSAYNIQFRNGKSILIDTLSFEKYQEGKPWIAYRQFCQHFLAPLALMAYTDVRLSQLLRIYIDGIPLDLASRLLPANSRLRFSLLSHIHLHSKSQKHFAGKQVNISNRTINRKSLQNIIDNLESTISKLAWQPQGTEWAEYYEDTNYSQEAVMHKKRLVEAYLSESKPRTVWDLGANTGLFSRIAMAKDIDAIAFDVDPAAVEKNYRQMQENKETKMLPLCLDLTNPSPSIGWANEERLSLINRGPADTVLALALVHHLAISNNVPFSHIAAFLRLLCRSLIIEFVPKNDSQVQRLLHSREDVFPDYDQEHFEASFGEYFSLIKRETIADTKRALYLMEKQSAN